MRQARFWAYLSAFCLLALPLFAGTSTNELKLGSDSAEFGSEAIFGGMAVAGMSLTPSEYWQRQCHVGASFLRPSETEVVREIGIGKFMWGSDYPHIAGSPPYTDAPLRLPFGRMTEEETTKVLTTNAARLYKFDVAALQALAEEHCPTKAHVASGIDYAEVPDPGKGCPGMAPPNQVPPVPIRVG